MPGWCAKYTCEDRRVVAAVLALLSPAAFAAEHANPTNPAGAGIFLGLAIAYLARRRSIGGWLLYFYMQLYVSFLITTLTLGQALENLNPSGWDNSFRYELFFLGTAPVLLAQLAETGVATWLLFKRDGETVRWLRGSLLALLIASGVALGIDLWKFNESFSIFMDVLTLAFSAIWLAYFFKARRVQLVFIEHAWNYELASRPRVLNDAERSYLRKRAVIAAVATFVLLLLLMGSGDQRKPDAGLFFVPIFYAAIAAAVGWYGPMTRRKRESLTHTASVNTEGSSRAHET